MLVDIIKYPEPVLLEKTKPVVQIDGALQKRIGDMFETLYAAPGLGLAAPQVGDPTSLFVYDLSLSDHAPEQNKGPEVILNPQIVEMEGEVLAEEGCLSIPGYFEKVKRAAHIFMTGLNREGKEISIEAEGVFARMLQHEVDHLNGVLMIDHFSYLKKNIFFRKYRKKMRRDGKR